MTILNITLTSYITNLISKAWSEATARNHRDIDPNSENLTCDD